MMHAPWTGPAVAAALLLAWAVPGRAVQETAAGAPPVHYDTRYGHDQYYPDPGVEVNVLPPTAVAVAVNGDTWHFDQGTWYRTQGDRFVVAAAPVGAAVPALPAFATPVTIGGGRFLYLNGTYYWHRTEGGGFEVVPEPEVVPGAPSAAAPAVAATARPAAVTPVPQAYPAPDKLIAYPRLGQSSSQQARDKEECHRWAVEQAGADPVLAASGQGPAASATQRDWYRRAAQACMEARAYVVR